MPWLTFSGLVLAVSLASCRGGCGDRAEPRGEPLELLRRVTSPSEATPAWVDIADDEAYFLVAGMRGPVQIWSEAATDTGSAASISAAGSVLAARFSQGGVFLALEQGAVTLWSWRENRVLSSHDFARRGRQATIDANGRFVAFGGAVLEVASSREVGEPKPLATQSALAFSTNGQRLVSAGFQEPWIVVRDLPSGALREWLAPGKVSHAALSPDANVVAASMENGQIQLWEQPSGKPLGSARGHKEARALCFNPAGTSLVVADPEGFSVLDVPRAEQTWRADIDGTLWVFACDGDMLAAGSTQGGVWLWELAHQTLRAHLQLSSSAVVAVDVSTARHRIAAADEKGEAAIWSWR